MDLHINKSTSQKSLLYSCTCDLKEMLYIQITLKKTINQVFDIENLGNSKLNSLSLQNQVYKFVLNWL